MRYIGRSSRGMGSRTWLYHLGAGQRCRSHASARSDGRLASGTRYLALTSSTDGIIRIDYGYLRRQEGGGVPQTFRTRQITFPVLFTVYHTLDAHSLDLVKLVPAQRTGRSAEHKGLSAPPMLSRKSSGGVTRRGGSFPSVDDALAREQIGSNMDGKHCLVALSIRNSYGVPFEVSLARKEPLGATEDDTVDEINTKRLVPPGATER